MKKRYQIIYTKIMQKQMRSFGVTLMAPQEEENKAVAPAEQAPQVAITPATRVGEILSRWPQTLDILVNNGFKPLADPTHRKKLKGLPVTLGMACARHGLDCGLIISLLNQAIASLEAEKRIVQPGPVALQAIAGRLKAGDTIGQQHIIGDILRVYPALEKVFRKYYGAACFSCPDQATESVGQRAMMHNVDENKVLAELNEAAGLMQ